MTRPMPAYDNQMAASQSTTTQAANLGAGQSRAKLEPAASVSQAPEYYFSGSSQQQQMNSNRHVQQQNHRQLQQQSHMLAGAGSDSYLAGMASDSELTGATSSARHHHAHAHHRPAYGGAGAPRAYHAHPSPRATHGSSRMSHYSDSAASYSAMAPANQMIGQHHQQQSPSAAPQLAQVAHHHQRAISHQGSVSSSASGGSVSSAAAAAGFVGVTGSGESPLSPGMAALGRAGRQLPQRPFKQSVSIDHQAGMYSAARQSPVCSNYQLGESGALERQQQSYQQQQQQQGAFFMGQRLEAQHPQQRGQQVYGQQTVGAETGSRSAHQYPAAMELMESQVAGMNLYESMGAEPLSQQQQSARPASASSMRQLPPMGAIAAAGGPSVGSLTGDLHYGHHSPHQQTQQMHHAYSQSEPLNQPAAGALGYPMGGLAAGGHHLQRAGQQFKQAMSIDHYAGQHSRPQSISSYHQQSPARSAGLSQGDHAYRSALNYASSSPVCGYESPTGYAGVHTPPGQSAASYAPGQSVGVAMYESATFARAHHQDPAMHQHHAHSQDSGQAHPRAPSSSTSGPSQRANLQHQLSSSSSNSQSGSLRLSNADVHKASSSGHDLLSQQQQQQRAAALPPQPQSFQSPQHKPPGGNLRHAALRKGYTSVHSDTLAMALSDSGELSASATLATPHHSSGSYGGAKRAAGMRANSPSIGLDAHGNPPSTSAHAHHPQQPHHQPVGQREASAGSRSESSTGLPAGGSSLTKKSNSATQLSMTGTKKRLGFRKKQVTSFSVHRSEEVAPFDARHLVKQGSSVSEGDSSMSGDSSSRSWSNSNFKQPTPDELASMSFIDGLGKGQMISRQGLASPYLGDIELSLCDRRGNLEVEVIRARNLQAKTSKVLPLTYVKLYLVKNRKCLAKAKTLLSNKRTLDPFFHQQLTFHEDYHGCILQSIIWGNFGKMDKKNFMGIAQISIDDLELSEQVVSWYKLFLPSSLQTLPSKSLRHTLLSNSTESFTNTNNS